MKIKTVSREWLKSIKIKTCALYFASRDKRVPWYSRLMIVCLIAYLLSPVDLIPDFIPVIGYLDDLVLVPAGIWLAIKLIPGPVWEACLQRASHQPVELHSHWLAVFVIIFTWFLVIALLIYILNTWMGEQGFSMTATKAA